MELTQTECSVVVNGKPKSVPADFAVDKLLAHLGRDPAMPGVAVAVNDAVVRRALWAETVVRDGDRIEIITASQGG